MVDIVLTDKMKETLTYIGFGVQYYGNQLLSIDTLIPVDRRSILALENRGLVITTFRPSGQSIPELTDLGKEIFENIRLTSNQKRTL